VEVGGCVLLGGRGCALLGLDWGADGFDWGEACRVSRSARGGSGGGHFLSVRGWIGRNFADSASCWGWSRFVGRFHGDKIESLAWVGRIGFSRFRFFHGVVCTRPSMCLGCSIVWNFLYPAPSSRNGLHGMGMDGTGAESRYKFYLFAGSRTLLTAPNC
jgi:hypothetical protein